jgi:hypothetical protein
MNEMQLGLFEPVAPITRSKHAKGATIQERFESFHRLNPHIYRRLRELCLEMKRRGVPHWGIKAAWEVLRFQGVLSSGQDGFRLPNSLTSRYARLLMEREPELQDFFETREIKTP